MNGAELFCLFYRCSNLFKELSDVLTLFLISNSKRFVSMRPILVLCSIILYHFIMLFVFRRSCNISS